MRKISLVFLAAVLLSTGNLLAKSPGTDPTKSLSDQIGELLEDNRLEIEEDLKATVLFTLNEQGEIVVFSVDTEDETFEKWVKARLNYEKVEMGQYTAGKMFRVPLRIEA